jgi:hypothetical protein
MKRAGHETHIRKLEISIKFWLERDETIGEIQI